MVSQLMHIRQVPLAKLQCVSYEATGFIRGSLYFASGEDVKATLAEGRGLRNLDAVDEAVCHRPFSLMFSFDGILGSG